MEHGNKIKRLVGACAKAALAVLAAAVFVHSAHADQPLKDVSREISDLRGTVVSAEVFLASKVLESRSEITESDLRKIACSYQATEKDDLDPLLDILANAAFVESRAPDDDDVRIAVYLKTSSSSVVPLLLGSEFTNWPTSGKYNGVTPVTAKKGFEDELRIWASQRKSTKSKCATQK